MSESFARSPRRRPTHAADPQLPPHSIEAEQGVLGCILLDPVDAVSRCIDQLRGPEAFYDLRHRTLYAAFMEMERRTIGIDLVTVSSFLKDRDQLEACGGVPYLSGLCDSVPSAAQVPEYLRIVSEKALMRRMLQTAHAAIGAAHTTDDPAEAVEQFVAEAIALTDSQAEAAVPEMKVLVGDAIDHIQTASEHRAKGLMLGLTTGFSYFDKKTGGLEKESLYVIGGRPSTGKTSWACSLILNMAQNGVRVGFISIEMSRRIITVRMLCSLAKANLKQVNSGFVSQGDMTRLVGASGILAKAPIDIVDRPGVTPAQLRSIGRRLCMRGCQVIVIDHLHEVLVPEANGANSEQLQAAQAAEAARWIARTCKVPVVALAQLSRSFEQEAAKSKFRIPRMTDLRGSGVMEQKADLIGILYKDEERVEDSDREDGEARRRVNFNELTNWPVTMEICKQRNGPTGAVEFIFERESLRYVDAYYGTGDKQAGARKAAREQEQFDV